jgi:hypothetical protein
MSIEKEMIITLLLVVYFSSTFHTSILYNVLKLQPNPIFNMAYYLYNRSSFIMLISFLILQNYPNGEESKSEEVKAFIRSYLLLGKRKPKGNSLLENFVDRLNSSLYGKKDKKEIMKSNDNAKNNQSLKIIDERNAKRKVSSSESTSDLSDHPYANDDSLELNKNQDRNNNTSHDFYCKKLINLPEENSEERKLIDKFDHKLLTDKLSDKEEQQLNKRIKKSNLGVWVNLSKSIYYSHFFYLLYSQFNVFSPQKSDLISLVSEIIKN